MEVVAKNDGEKEEKSQMIERKTEICKRKKDTEKWRDSETLSSKCKQRL